MTGEARDSSDVKIMVHTQSQGGYPPEEWEGLWAIPLEGGLFRIDNIPFYAKGLSCDDIVAASLIDGEYRFLKIISPSTNSTFRIVVYDLKDEEQIRSSLQSLGCAIEGTGTAGLLSVNVPREAREGVEAFVRDGLAAEKLDYEEAALR
jgi:hypothetical protein